MARKTYTEEDRARVRQALLDTGLNMAVSKGLKGLHLAELAAAVGISKPYFYTFFDSLEDFSLQMMEEQRCRLLRLLEQELARPEGIWEEHVESFFRTILRHRENGILVMTQGEEVKEKKATLIFLDHALVLTKQVYADWHEVQAEYYAHYKANLEPLSYEEIINFLNEEYENEMPFSEKELRQFFESDLQTIYSEF